MIKIKLGTADCDLRNAVDSLTALFMSGCNGQVALVPTDTIYGLIARADDKLAIERIYELKHRPVNKRMGWFIGNWRKLADFGVLLTPIVEQIADKYTPGALTIIAGRSSGDTIGFRVPDYPLLHQLMLKLPFPLVQTSANGSGMPDAVDCDDALSQLHGEVEIAVDGGVVPPDHCGSTVVDASGDVLKILRQGSVKLPSELFN